MDQACFLNQDTSFSPGVYVFHGTEQYLKRQAVAQLRTRLISPAFEMLNVQMLSGNPMRADALRSACDTLPFGAPHRLVIVQDFAPFSEKEGNDAMYTLLSHCADLPHLFLLIVMPQRISVSQGLLKRLAKKIDITEFKEPSAAQAANILSTHAAQLPCRLQPGDAQYLYTCTGSTLEQAVMELEKAMCYAGAGNTISRQIIDTVCIKEDSARLFDALNALLSGNAALGLERYQQLLEQGESPFALLSMAGRQLNAMLLAPRLAAGGRTAAQGEEILKVKAFALERMQRQSTISAAQLQELVDFCAQLDHDAKQGRCTGETAALLLAQRIAAMRRGAR